MSNSVTSWQKWSAAQYLQTYFLNPGTDIIENLKFIIDELERHKICNVPILDFGSGPTLITALAAEPYSSELHLSDYLHENLHELQLWKKSHNNVFDWSSITKRILSFESKSDSDIEARLRHLSAKIKTTQVIHCDASKKHPISSGGLSSYPVVISNFCADSATNTKEAWSLYMGNILSLVSPGGLIIGGLLRNCKQYLVGDCFFPSPDINEFDLIKVLRDKGFDETTFNTKIVMTPECESQGFSSILFYSARKSTGHHN